MDIERSQKPNKKKFYFVKCLPWALRIVIITFIIILIYYYATAITITQQQYQQLLLQQLRQNATSTNCSVSLNLDLKSTNEQSITDQQNTIQAHFWGALSIKGKLPIDRSLWIYPRFTSIEELQVYNDNLKAFLLKSECLSAYFYLKKPNFGGLYLSDIQLPGYIFEHNFGHTNSLIALDSIVFDVDSSSEEKTIQVHFHQFLTNTIWCNFRLKIVFSRLTNQSELGEQNLNVNNTSQQNAVILTNVLTS